jgi:hypothetical protein
MVMWTTILGFLTMPLWTRFGIVLLNFNVLARQAIYPTVSGIHGGFEIL